VVVVACLLLGWPPPSFPPSLPPSFPPSLHLSRLSRVIAKTSNPTTTSASYF